MTIRKNYAFKREIEGTLWLVTLPDCSHLLLRNVRADHHVENYLELLAGDLTVAIQVVHVESDYINVVFHLPYNTLSHLSFASRLLSALGRFLSIGLKRANTRMNCLKLMCSLSSLKMSANAFFGTHFNNEPMQKERINDPVAEGIDCKLRYSQEVVTIQETLSALVQVDKARVETDDLVAGD